MKNNMAIGGSLTKYYDNTTMINWYGIMQVSDEEYDRRFQRTPRCGSCGMEHGPSLIYPGDKCEITMVKEMEAREAQEKKHNENIRKLYWERFIKA